MMMENTRKYYISSMAALNRNLWFSPRPYDKAVLSNLEREYPGKTAASFGRRGPVSCAARVRIRIVALFCVGILPLGFDFAAPAAVSPVPPILQKPST